MNASFEQHSLAFLSPVAAMAADKDINLPKTNHYYCSLQNAAPDHLSWGELNSRNETKKNCYRGSL